MANWKDACTRKAKKGDYPHVWLLAEGDIRATAGYLAHNDTFSCSVRGVDDDLFDLSAEQVEQHFTAHNIDLNGNWQ